MKILFIGWNDNGEKCLSNLLAQKFDVVQVFVPSGYETKKMFEISKTHNLPIMEVGTNMDEMRERVFELKPDLIVIASFPKLISQEVIDLPPLGAINVHTGELPKYRGWHPLNWAIIRDEDRVGVTVHYIDKGMDTGDILEQGTVPVTNIDDIHTVREPLTTLGSELLIKAVKRIKKSNKKIKGIEQRESQVLFAPKRTADDGRIKWTNRGRDIFNLIRALAYPIPNAFAFRESGEKVSISKSFVTNSCGEVLAKVNDQYLVSTGDGVILITTDTDLKIGEKLL